MMDNGLLDSVTHLATAPKLRANEFMQMLEAGDLGPETDVDAVDDAAVAAANNNPQPVQRDLLEVDLELQRQQTSEFDATGAQRDETPTPPADLVLDNSSLVDNVAESGDDSDDEWNYYSVDPKQQKGSATQQERREQEDQIEQQEAQQQATTGLGEEESVDEEPEDMSQLNPDAAEFVPVSPTRNVASPVYGRDMMDDMLIAQSPRRAIPMDIDVPNPVEFQCEVKQRPSDGVFEGFANSNDDDQDHKLTSQEIMENLLNGKNVNDIEFHPTNFPASPIQTNPFNVDFNSVETAEKSDEKDTTDFEKCDFIRKEQDPMSMSYYQDKDEEGDAFATDPFDLNKVQPLPDSVDDDIEELAPKENEPEIIHLSPTDIDIHQSDTMEDDKLSDTRSPLPELHSPSVELSSPVGPLSPKSPIPELQDLISPDITASMKDENLSPDIVCPSVPADIHETKSPLPEAEVNSEEIKIETADLLGSMTDNTVQQSCDLGSNQLENKAAEVEDDICKFVSDNIAVMQETESDLIETVNEMRGAMFNIEEVSEEETKKVTEFEACKFDNELTNIKEEVLENIRTCEIDVNEFGDGFKGLQTIKDDFIPASTLPVVAKEDNFTPEKQPSPVELICEYPQPPELIMSKEEVNMQNDIEKDVLETTNDDAITNEPDILSAVSSIHQMTAEASLLLQQLNTDLTATKSELLEHLNTSATEADVDSFLERSVLPEITSPLSPCDATQTSDRPELWKETEIKCETISPEYAVHTITTPSEESRGEDLPLPVPAALTTEPEVAIQKTAEKPKSAKKLTTKVSSPAPAAKKTTTTTSKPSATKTTPLKPKTTTPVPSPRVPASKTTPIAKPRVSSEKKPPMANGDVKTAVRQPPPIRRPVPGAVPAKPAATAPKPSAAAAPISKTVANGTSKLMNGVSSKSPAARPASAPSKTAPRAANATTTATTARTRPTSLAAKSATSSSTTTKTSTTLTKTTTLSSTKSMPSTTAALKPKVPSTTTRKPITKAADAEKQIKESANKQLSASRSTNTRTTLAAKTTTTSALKKTESKAPTSKPTSTTRTTTTSVRSVNGKKPTEVTRTTVTKTKSSPSKLPADQNGVVSVIQEITTVSVVSSDEPQLVKDSSPVLPPLLDNSQLPQSPQITAD